MFIPRTGTLKVVFILIGKLFYSVFKAVINTHHVNNKIKLVPDEMFVRDSSNSKLVICFYVSFSLLCVAYLDASGIA